MKNMNFVVNFTKYSCDYFLFWSKAELPRGVTKNRI